MRPLASQLGLPLDMYRPDGPQAFDMGPGRQWFSVKGVTETDRPGRVEKALPAFTRIIEAFGDPLEILLVGFSQGAIVVELVTRLRAEDGLDVPALARAALMALAAQLDGLASQIRGIERQLMAWHRQSAASRRLETIPGVGLTTATALAASVPDPGVFRSARQFAAWLGLVPKQNSSGGNARFGPVSKMGNRFLRRLLVVGATSVSRRAGTDASRTGLWVRSLLERKPARLVTVASANKTARTAWALLIRGETYKGALAG